MARSRKPLSSSVRFEVFKRDSFRCQYCGAESPQVLLHVDHIKPVSKGGNNDLTNLITSCETCNQGKGAKTLDDQSAMQKSRRQLEELQARREQLEMMMQWKEGLLDIADETVTKIKDYWQRLVPGFTANQSGTIKIKSWTQKFTIVEIAEAMDESAKCYLSYNTDGTLTKESVEKTFLMIPKIAYIQRQSKDNPEIKDIVRIKGALKKRFPDEYKPWDMDSLIERARENGYSLDEIRKEAWNAYSFYHFTKFCKSI